MNVTRQTKGRFTVARIVKTSVADRYDLFVGRSHPHEHLSIRFGKICRIRRSGSARGNALDDRPLPAVVLS